MIIVEVTLPDSFEIHHVPSVPNLPWSDDNILALQIVYDGLVDRRVCLDGFSMLATNLDYERDGLRRNKYRPITRH